MATLTDYLGSDTLKQLAGTLAEAAGIKVRILDPEGKVLAGPPLRGASGAATAVAAPTASAVAEAKIIVAGAHVGTISLAGRTEDPSALRLLGLMRDMMTRLCEQGHQLRERVEELAAMYRLTAVFSERKDLAEVHQLVAETMVKVTGADACSIRVLSENRTELVTIAAYGLSREYMAKGKILLADSHIDQEVLAAGQPVYVADERRDARVLYKTAARREGLVSALCVPMAYKGRIEGIVRVYTKKPHVFDWFETSLMVGVASQAATAIVNARLYAEALEAEVIRRQLRMAGEVQRRMIPPSAPRIAGLDIAAVYVPCFELGGDFYDFIELPNRNLGLCVADVVGKGVRASLLMASARSSLRAHAAHLYELSAVLSAVNHDMCLQSEEADFLTMFYGVLDVPRRRLTYCSAGHEPAVLVRDGVARPLACAGGVIGMDERMTFPHSVLELRPGDLLVIYTDGLPEALNFQDDTFGRRRVMEAAVAAAGKGETAEGVGRHLLWEMRRFTGLQTRCDDLTLVAIKVQ